MKQVLVILVVLVCCNLASARAPMHWNKGSVVDKDGQVKVGEIAIQTNNLILFKVDDQVTVYTPFHIRSFFYFDQDLKMNRKYSVQRVDNRNSSFYEIVLWGQIQIVRAPKAKGLLQNHKSSDIDDFNYFILWNGSFSKIEDFKDSVYPNMLKSLSSFDENSQKLKMTTSYLENVLELVKLYNKLSLQQGEALASN